MKIGLKHITVKDIFDGYLNDDENNGGVVGYGELLNIRPAYQRNYVYKDKQRDKVIDTVLKGLPLNVMYWVHNEDDTYEVLDGQQRTISICDFVNGDFSVLWNGKTHYFYTLTEDVKKKILEYELTVYICEGTDSEKLDWFQTINIAGEKLLDQELRNAVYYGPEKRERFASSAMACPGDTLAASRRMRTSPLLRMGGGFTGAVIWAISCPTATSHSCTARTSR